ncbi:MAG: hypothetical protein ACLP05_02405 [Candidatus Kryptoniota bacterium]
MRIRVLLGSVSKAQAVENTGKLNEMYVKIDRPKLTPGGEKRLIDQIRLMNRSNE